MTDILVRAAREAEYGEVGDLTAAAYLADGLIPADHDYFAVLRDAATRARCADLLVADLGGVIGGTVTYCMGGTEYADIAKPGEAEFRMLAVAPAARRRGVGETLVRECVERARRQRRTVLRLSTHETMRSARRIYDRLGFARTPELDWSAEAVALLAYALVLE